MTRVWRCNGWVTSRQRSFEMKRQSVFCSEWWKMVEVLVESLKCSGGQWSVAPQHIISKVCHRFPSGASDCGIYRRGLPVGRRICGRSCGIMVTTSSKVGSNFAEGNPICWPFMNLEGGEICIVCALVHALFRPQTKTHFEDTFLSGRVRERRREDTFRRHIKRRRISPRRRITPRRHISKTH